MLLLAVETPNRRRQLLAALLLGLATLTRPDGVLFCALGVAYGFCAAPRASLRQRLADSATVMGLLEEARMARARGHKVAQQAGSVKTFVGRAKDWFLGNF